MEMAWSRLPSRASHSRTKPSGPVVTMDRLLGLKSRWNTPPSCASTCQRTVQLLVSNTLSWLPPAASKDPSGLKPMWPADVAGGSKGNPEGTEGCDDRARVEVPHRGGEALPSSGGASAVGRDGHPQDPLGVGVIRGKDGTVPHWIDIVTEPLELGLGPSGSRVAHHDGPDRAGEVRALTHEVLINDGAAVGGKREHLAGMVGEPTDDLTGSRIEDEGSDLIRERHHGGDPSSRIDGPRADLPGAQIEGHRLPERPHREVPHPGGPVAPERGQPVSLVVHRKPKEAMPHASQGDQVRSGGRVPDPSGPVEASRVGQAPVVAEPNVGGASLLTGQEA